MRTLPNTAARSHWRRSAWGVVLCLLSAGCSTIPAETYTYNDLPTTLVAARVPNPHTLDLTRLGGNSKKNGMIGNGDVLQVTIAAGLSEKETVSIPIRVQENGVASLPVIGPVPLAGLDVETAEAAIVEACMERELYRNPHVTVTIAKQRTNRVMVIGAVRSPDIYELPRGNCDLLAALVAAGGLAEDAGTIVEIRNPTAATDGAEPPRIAGDGSESGEGGDGESSDGVKPAGHSTISSRSMKSIQVDLVSATRAGAEPLVLEDGGVVNVEKRDPEPVFVQGLVNKPDRYDYPVAEELRLLGAISMAGGLKNPVADKVYVIRRKPNSTDTVMVSLKISDAKRNDNANLLLAPGDVVTVETTAATVLIDSLRMMNFGMAASMPLTYFF